MIKLHHLKFFQYWGRSQVFKALWKGGLPNFRGKICYRAGAAMENACFLTPSDGNIRRNMSTLSDLVEWVNLLR